MEVFYWCNININTSPTLKFCILPTKQRSLPDYPLEMSKEGDVDQNDPEPVVDKYDVDLGEMEMTAEGG